MLLTPLVAGYLCCSAGPAACSSPCVLTPCIELICLLNAGVGVVLLPRPCLQVSLLPSATSAYSPTAAGGGWAQGACLRWQKDGLHSAAVATPFLHPCFLELPPLVTASDGDASPRGLGRSCSRALCAVCCAWVALTECVHWQSQQHRCLPAFMHCMCGICTRKA